MLNELLFLGEGEVHLRDPLFWADRFDDTFKLRNFSRSWTNVDPTVFALPREAKLLRDDDGQGFVSADSRGAAEPGVVVVDLPVRKAV